MATVAATAAAPGQQALASSPVAGVASGQQSTPATLLALAGGRQTPVTRNRTRDHLITARILQSDALPTEL